MARTSESSLPEVLATIGDDRVTLSDVRTRVGEELDKMEARYRRAQHSLIESTLETMVRERVLEAEAKKHGKTVDELLAAEVGGTLEPTEVEVSTWYQENQSRVRGRSLDQIRTQIADFLREERRKEGMDKLEQRLTTERKVVVNLEPYRLPVDDPRAPSRGPVNAPVTLVEFSDFQCPFCSRFHPTLKQLEEKFGDKLRIVYRQYPITSLHPFAFKAAEASLCANDQKKFWDMHDMMFRQQDRLAAKDLKAIAGSLGLNQDKFDSCLDSGRYAEQVQQDLKDGSGVGVTGTPALFVNGVPLPGGAVSFEVVSKAIEKEIARADR